MDMPDNTTMHPSAIETPFSNIEDIIADIRDGKMVVMVDDEDRENEGDLIMAAALVRPEDVNYMATHGRGLICLTLMRERCGFPRRTSIMRPTSRSPSRRPRASRPAFRRMTGHARSRRRLRRTRAPTTCASRVTSSRSWPSPAVY